MGMMKRIGPRETSIWRENWIPSLRSIRPLVRLQTSNAKVVSDLFVPGTRVWDEGAMRRSFMLLEVVEVLKIKLGVNLENDILAWAFEKFGFTLFVGL